MNKSETPKRVIRFYGNVDYALESIALKQITYIRVDKLNDPFDPVLVDFTRCDYKSLLVYVQENHPTELILFKERLPGEKWGKLVTAFSELAKESRERLFVFSTCKVSENKEEHPRDNLYMWGHYGSGHRGAAVEFDTDVLSESFIGKHKRGKIDTGDSRDFFWEMNYERIIPKVEYEAIFEFVINASPDVSDMKLSKLKLGKYIDKIACLKAEVWEHEDEWRLVHGDAETKLKFYRYDLPDNAITKVYLGCRVSGEMKDQFIYETESKFPNAKVFQAKMKQGEFALEFEQIYPAS